MKNYYVTTNTEDDLKEELYSIIKAKTPEEAKNKFLELLGEDESELSFYHDSIAIENYRNFYMYNSI